MVMQAQVYTGTTSQQASADQHYARRDEWSYVRSNGTRYVVLPSGSSDHVYQVRADGNGCSCKWYLSGGAVCSHMLSVRRDIEARAAVEVAHQEVLQAWLDDQAEDFRVSLIFADHAGRMHKPATLDVLMDRWERE